MGGALTGCVLMLSLQYWEFELELVSNQLFATSQLQFIIAQLVSDGTIF